MTQEPVQRKLQFVLEKYGIKPKNNILLNYFSMGNEIFYINSDTNKFVLKNCIKKRSIDKILVEIELMKYLNANGCPSLEVVPDLNGNQIVEYNGDFYLMTRFIQGKSLQWNTPKKKYMFTESLKGLAIYHKTVSSFDKTIDTDLIKSFNHEALLKLFIDLKNDLFNDKSQRESISRMKNIIDKIIYFIKQMQGILTKDVIDKCEKLMIHGDFHFYNIIFRSNKFYACYDFEFIRRDLKIFDISWLMTVIRTHYFKMRFGKKFYNKDFKISDKDELELKIKSFKWLKKYYLPIYSLNETELKTLPFFEIVRFIYWSLFFKISNSEEECLHHVDWFEYQLDNMEKQMDFTSQSIKEIFNI